MRELALAEAVGGPLDGQMVEIDPTEEAYTPDGYDPPTPVKSFSSNATYYVGGGWYQRLTRRSDGGHELRWWPVDG